MDKIIIILTVIYCNLDVCLSEDVCPETGNLCYTISDVSSSWLAAEQSCHTQGAVLASYDTLPSQVLQETTQDSLWLKQTAIDLPSFETFKWLGDADISLETNVVEKSDSLRGCLGLTYRITGKLLFSDNCEAGHHFICETEQVRDCIFTKGGLEYLGTVSTTREEFACEQWSGQDQIFQDGYNFPFETVEEAHKYCRNPRNYESGVWCHVNQTPQTIQYCQIPKCINESNPCFETTEGNLDATSLFCTNRKCYIAVDTATTGAKTWLDAQKCCASIGANLAQFDSQNLLNQVYDKLTPFLSTARIDDMWIGGHTGVWESLVTNQSGNDVIKCSAWERSEVGVVQTECEQQRRYICEKAKSSTTAASSSTISTTTTPTTSTAGSISASSPTASSSQPTSSVDSSSSRSPGSSSPSPTLTQSTTVMNSNTSGASNTQNDDGNDSKLFMYIGIGGAAAVALIILIVISAACACYSTKPKKEPFTHYSHEIAPYGNSNTNTRNTFYDNSEFTENDIYDSSDIPAASHYDVPKNGGSVIMDKPSLNYSQSQFGAADNLPNYSQIDGLDNPMFDNDHKSIYSQPSKKSKNSKQNQNDNFDELDNSMHDYAELPDLPPRTDAEHQTQTSSYYNY